MGKKKELVLDESTTEKRCAVIVSEAVHTRFVEYVNRSGGKITAVVEALMCRCVDEKELDSPLMGEKKGKRI